MDADGKNLKRLTEDSTEYGHAIISPDNHFITFEGLLAGQKRLFIMKLDGSEKRQVTTNEDYSTIMPDFIYIK
jgi:Tol biopolymer transport system component